MTGDEIQQIFFQECDEGLSAAEAGLLLCQAGAQDEETINTIFRAVHSIKGGAGAFGFAALQSFTHHFETVLDRVRSDELALTPAVLATLLAAFDTLADHVTAIRGQDAAPDDAAILARLQSLARARDASPADTAAPIPPAPATMPDAGFDLDALLAGLNAAALPGRPPWRVIVRPEAAALAGGSEPLLLLRELKAIGGRIVDVDTGAVPDLDRFDADGAYLAWTFEVPGAAEKAAIAEIFDFIADDCAVSITAADEDMDGVCPSDADTADAVSGAAALPAPALDEVAAAAVETVPPAPPTGLVAERRGAERRAQDAQTIRVDLDKLDRLVNLVGELVITQSMLSQRLLMRGLGSIDELGDLDHLTRELQDSAMSIRAQPVRWVFSRVPRIVRELEASTGKRVRLEVEGEATELDKTVIERIGEPLTHLIRNAVDHGIEDPARRIAAGKPAEGRLRLSAEHRGGRILIIVSDDGAGIDRTRVLAKAVEKGIVAPDARLSDEEIDHLIFAPGFSTAQQVSNISGRGVGMDVVKQNVLALGGRISIQSVPGRGSTFTLALPLTLAILDGMIVSVADQTYIIPLTHIVESLRPAAGAVKSMGNGQHVLNVRGTYLPVLAVAEQLAIGASSPDPSSAVLIVVETEVHGQAVLMVDAINDQRQVVIKSLETHYRQIDGVAGATILGDGRVALILDVESLVAHRAAGADRIAA
ncbi:chemotaxis protein CheA [Sphingomonas metalli]|uniref:Chemotaxis protein CheA n=1 Tax=Sphingomonas metalli TaxID=1779358 RepID=A0A916TD67_9SPHN|nr:chemotaxis protein CheA [Sphingomonas metalli]GGB40461.1 chemotaxis protein CheA [Sphingomonas metalli]